MDLIRSHLDSRWDSEPASRKKTSVTSDSLVADVPFSFIAGHDTFPAGHYVFSLDDPMESSVLTIESKNGNKVEVLLTEAEARGEAANHSKLVFDECGEDHFLAQVWVAGLDEGRILAKSRVQREYANLVLQREVIPGAAVH